MFSEENQSLNSKSISEVRITTTPAVLRASGVKKLLTVGCIVYIMEMLRYSPRPGSDV
jgi:hypothetical protein